MTSFEPPARVRRALEEEGQDAPSAEEVEQLELDGLAAPKIDAPALGKFQRDAMNTSREAAASIYHITGKQRRAVLEAFIQAGERGLTDDEGEVLLDGIRFRTRRDELMKEHGIPIVDSGRTRRTRRGRNAEVWVYRPQGRPQGSYESSFPEGNTGSTAP